MERRKSRKLTLGWIPVGGDAPVSVQSMTNTLTWDVRATLRQIEELHAVGCDIVRVALPDLDSCRALKEIVKASPVPVVADVHFDHRIALEAIRSGAHGLRINPGNIGDERKVREIARAAREMGVPVRVGANAGSLPRDVLKTYGGPTPQALVESALREVSVLEREGFDLIEISVKSSSVPVTIEANLMIAEKVDYPLHLGVSEAGPIWSGTIKSAVGIGALLAQGIGDTIRVSLAGDPVEEVRVGRAILRSLGLSSQGPDIVACPTCARARIDVAALAEELEKRLRDHRLGLRIAVMGCSVNGPGEAREADLGIAGGKTRGLLFRKGSPVAWYPKDRLLDVLLEEVAKVSQGMTTESEEG